MRDLKKIFHSQEGIFCPLLVPSLYFTSQNENHMYLKFYSCIYSGLQKTGLFDSLVSKMWVIWMESMNLKSAAMLFFNLIANKYSFGLPIELLFIIIAQEAAKLGHVKFGGLKKILSRAESKPFLLIQWP